MTDTEITQMAHTDTYYTVDEACEILKISRRTLYHWLKKGKFKSKKEGKNRLILLSGDSTIEDIFPNAQTTQNNSQTTQNNSQTTQNNSQTTQDSSQTTQTNQNDMVGAIKQLEVEVDRLKTQNELLHTELFEMRKEMTEASKRHDTIVMQLSNTINEQQFKLQKSEPIPIWKRMFGIS